MTDLGPNTERRFSEKRQPILKAVPNQRRWEMSETVAERKARLEAMGRHALIDYIFALEERVWPGHGHLGSMDSRARSNLVSVALMYHQIEDDAALA